MAQGLATTQPSIFINRPCSAGLAQRLLVLPSHTAVKPGSPSASIHMPPAGFQAWDLKGCIDPLTPKEHVVRW